MPDLHAVMDMRIEAGEGISHTPFPAGASIARSVNRAIGDMRRGVAVIIRADDETRLLALPAETATPATLQEFLAASGGGPVLVLSPSRAADLGLETVAAPQPTRPGELATVAIPLLRDRLDAVSLRRLADPTALPASPRRLQAGPAGPAPFGVAAAQAGVLLAKLGRLLPAVLMAPQAEPRFATDLLEVGAAQILAYPSDTSDGLVRAAEASVPLEEAGDARVIAFRPPDGGIEHLALVIGRPEQAEGRPDAPLVRVHSECFTGDLLGSKRCDCGPQLHQAIRRMAEEGAGVLLYMAQEGRGIGLVNKLRAYTLQDGRLGQPGLDTLDANRALGYGADERSFAAAATMLKRLGITRIRLLTNNPEKIAGLTAHGIEVTGRVSHSIAANGVNDGYLETKARRFGHLLG